MLDDDFEILGALVLMAGTILLSIVVGAFLALLGGWVVMIAAGDLHHIVHPVPTIGPRLRGHRDLAGRRFLGEPQRSRRSDRSPSESWRATSTCGSPT